MSGAEDTPIDGVALTGILTALEVVLANAPDDAYDGALDAATRLVISYGTYDAPEAVAAVFRSLRTYLERDETPPIDHDELRAEAVLLRAALDQAISGAESGGYSHRP